MNPESAIFFSGWLPIVRVLVVGSLGYLFLLLVLKAVGPRTLAKTNLFDFIILVSIGSIYGRILTAQEVSLVEACVAYALVALMHYAVSWLRTRSKLFASLFDAEPVLLFYQGIYVHRSMKRARVTKGDIEAAARERGLGSMAGIEAIVLEADGELSVIESSREVHDLVVGLRRRCPD